MSRRGRYAQAAMAAVSTAIVPPAGDWRQELPVLAGDRVSLREVRVDDARSLVAMVTTEEVTRFMPPAPPTVEAFERFISRAQDQRRQGEGLCYAVVPCGMDTPVGLIEVRETEPGFTTAEASVALGSGYWGTGLFEDGAGLVLSFLFDTIGLHRLEARTVVGNGRGNGALRKIGAVQEGLLRRSFLRHGVYHDQVLWSMLAEDWRWLRRDEHARIH